MNARLTIGLMLCFLLLQPGYSQSKQTIVCTIQGKLIDLPQTTHLILHKQNEDLRIHGIHIPVADGKFNYVLECDYEEQYQLVFNDEYENGAWKPVPFFSENGTIRFALNASGQSKENKPEGGKLTTAYWDYLSPIQDEYDETEKEFLAKSRLYLEEHYGAMTKEHASEEKNLRAKLEELKEEGVDINPIMQKVSEMEKQIGEEVNRKVRLQALNFIKENPTIVGYSVLVFEATALLQRNDLRGENNDISPYADIYKNVFASAFLNHPYSERMENLFAGAAIKVGAPYIDFATGDLNGKPVKLSERITGKPAILNLWASWCGPCRRKGKELIPVYEEFKEKGFVVIGVAREKDVATAVAAIKYDGYPWENLVELNDAEKIWEKYGLGNSGGRIFLIDEKGFIVAKDPSAEEVRNFLREEMNK